MSFKNVNKSNLKEVADDIRKTGEREAYDATTNKEKFCKTVQEYILFHLKEGIKSI